MRLNTFFELFCTWFSCKPGTTHCVWASIGTDRASYLTDWECIRFSLIQSDGILQIFLQFPICKPGIGKCIRHVKADATAVQDFLNQKVVSGT